MKLIILAGILVVAATSMAQPDQHPQSECCHLQKYHLGINSTLKDPKKKPWHSAIRVGQILYATSMRAFEDIERHKEIISKGGTHNETLRIMDLTGQILHAAGCTWNDVHDVVVLFTDSPANFTTTYEQVNATMHEFCDRPENNCSGFPWTAHFRTAKSMKDNATVEFTVQASNCDWKGEVADRIDKDKSSQPECCSVSEHSVSKHIMGPNHELDKLIEGSNKPYQSAVRVGQILYLSSVRAPDHVVNGFENTDRLRSTNLQAEWIMRQLHNALENFGCRWYNVHDVTVLVTGGPDEYHQIDTAVKDFCKQPIFQCASLPWAAHLRTAPSLTGKATVEFTLQASNCHWTEK
ncbi:uncharacterized protein LOC129596900 [Paramacrobiotus metropolitanus]|uniref:uncharacterized protein LOC129596900 n=1 Tax=Paramacrobiotus metropolitanus TaxID=2943436 RepID=UPI0024458ACA|nr:uncharacterized protein LOC129596900 [Paramacrobiotus metropolitanus]